jgi:hypothetical protein
MRRVLLAFGLAGALVLGGAAAVAAAGSKLSTTASRGHKRGTPRKAVLRKDRRHARHHRRHRHPPTRTTTTTTTTTPTTTTQTTTTTTTPTTTTSTTPTTTTSTTTTTTPPPTTASPVFGVTIDDISNISNVISDEQALPYRPTTRVYFDVNESASYYSSAVAALHNGPSAVMGELLDSADETSISTSAFNTRVASYLSTLGANVDIWEIGNEVNGNWLGSYSTVAANLTEAYDAVHAAGAKTALTLYSNNWTSDNCGDGTSELTPIQFTQQYVPASVADGVNYVWLSYYPTQCNNTYPSAAQVTAYVQQLHALYPNALIGFGELGLPNAATSSTLATAQQVMSWGYGLQIPLPYYVGGYFWWYGAEDCFSSNPLMLSSLTAAFRSEAAALGG